MADFIWESMKDAGDSAGRGIRDWWSRMRDRFEDDSDGKSVQEHFRDASKKAKERLEKWLDALKDWLNSRSRIRDSEIPEDIRYEIIRTGPWSDDNADEQQPQGTLFCLCPKRFQTML